MCIPLCLLRTRNMCVGDLNQGHPHSEEYSHHSSWSTLFFSPNSILCVSRLMTNYWCCIDLLWIRHKGRSEDPAVSPDSSFARFLREVSQRAESIWNSRRSNRFKEPLGFLIHHLINSALLYSDLGSVPIFLLNTSNTSNRLWARVKFGGLSQQWWVIAE